VSNRSEVEVGSEDPGGEWTDVILERQEDDEM
jgi:hypothetical protein